VNVVPSRLARAADYFMNRPLDAFAVSNVGAFRAVGELRRRLDPQFVPRDWDGAGSGTLNTPITLSLTRATPRAILNEIARRHGALSWSSTFDRAAGRVADWVVTLVPMDHAGPPIALGAQGGALAPALTPPAYAPTSLATGSRPVMLDLPVTGQGVRNMLGLASRATGASIGFASVAPASSVRPFGSEYYNLTGLPMADVLAALERLSPDYVTSEDRGVYHVRLRQPPRELTAWLDQRIARFDHKFENLRDAMNVVAAIGSAGPGPMRGMRQGGGGAGAAGAPPVGAGGTRGVPGGVAGGVVGGIPNPPPAATPSPSDTMTARLQKTMTFAMTNVTVREILDEIARQFGALVWTVEQRTNPTGVSMFLSFSSDNWTTGTSVR
jgi:hypothetical protein